MTIDQNKWSIAIWAPIFRNFWGKQNFYINAHFWEKNNFCKNMSKLRRLTVSPIQWWDIPGSIFLPYSFLKTKMSIWGGEVVIRYLLNLLISGKWGWIFLYHPLWTALWLCLYEYDQIERKYMWPGYIDQLYIDRPTPILLYEHFKVFWAFKRRSNCKTETVCIRWSLLFFLLKQNANMIVCMYLLTLFKAQTIWKYRLQSQLIHDFHGNTSGDVGILKVAIFLGHLSYYKGTNYCLFLHAHLGGSSLTINQWS